MRTAFCPTDASLMRRCCLWLMPVVADALLMPVVDACGCCPFRAQSPSPTRMFSVSVGNPSSQLRESRAVRTSAALSATWVRPVSTAFVVDVKFDAFHCPDGHGGGACEVALECSMHMEAFVCLFVVLLGLLRAVLPRCAVDCPVFYCMVHSVSVLALSARRRWSVVHQLGGGAATSLATSATHKHMKLIPLGGVAAPLDCSHALTTDPSRAVGVGAGGASTDVYGSDASSLAVQGKAFCFLPLPVNTRLPVHVRVTKLSCPLCPSCLVCAVTAAQAFCPPTSLFFLSPSLRLPLPLHD